MNNDFPRLLTLLRKERGISQKQAAMDLGVQQALLSHYENGKRECGLDFLVRAADYYSVSTDYLLGRSPVTSGEEISARELPDSAVSERYSGASSGAMTFFSKKLLTNAMEVIFSLLIKANNTDLSRSVCSYLQIAVYRCYRMVFSSNKQNDEHSFAIPDDEVGALTTAALSIEETRAMYAGKKGTQDERITTSRLEKEFPSQEKALRTIVNTSEKNLSKIR